MKQVPMCSSRQGQGASYGMQHDLPRSLRDLDLRSRPRVDLLRSRYISFDSARRKKHSSEGIIALS